MLHVIVVDAGLGRRERKAALAHELVHLERGGGCLSGDHMPAAWSAVVARDEATVDRIVAERLIPRSALVDWLARRDQPTTATDVAEELDTTEAVAVEALGRLLDR